MPKHPQCPKCGDNISPLSPTSWRPTLNPADRGDASRVLQHQEYRDDIATRGVCALCHTTIREQELIQAAAGLTPAADPQAELVAAVSAGVPPASAETLRDRFAMTALKPILSYALANEVEAWESDVVDEMARNAYRMADAMIAARAAK